ncbi:helix-turn-helix transcriptional regulator [Tissierella creatinophila]|uniref:Helix-turn-helix protein n=1 Tax=Tissierella creatinophila DSM 6911 TaxID=1123403 RepID=A0A1U7M6Q0_TISCR|nr:helix-turn-helix domain-containing protein [Tissierella creatinophila]OLS02868.1 helix-turn-helix protein [Tissierella creatinophila DSM 6911]
MVKNRLKEIRMKEYMSTQGEFAKILELNYRQYNRYENGTVPNLETALHISKKLNKNLEEVFYLD